MVEQHIPPEPTHRDFPASEQETRRVLYCFAWCAHNQLLEYIRDAKLPKDDCGNLKRVFVANTTTRKLQLKQELNNVRQGDMSLIDYTTKIKEIYDLLDSINVTVDEDEMVQICLGGLA